MSLFDRLRKPVGVATVATVAVAKAPVQTPKGLGAALTVATVAAVAVADSPRNVDSVDSGGFATATPATPATTGAATEAGSDRYRQNALTIRRLAKQDTSPDTASCSWSLVFEAGALDLLAVPAVSRGQLFADYPALISAEVAQSCQQCAHHIRPGMATGYCSNPERADLAPAYGSNHLAKNPPSDQGVTCECFERVRRETA